MAYIFISDGGPDAEEYENNYFYFNESDEQTLLRIEKFISNKDITDPNARRQLHRICQSSFNHIPPLSYGMIYWDWMDRIRDFINQFFHKSTLQQ